MCCVLHCFLLQATPNAQQEEVCVYKCYFNSSKYGWCDSFGSVHISLLNLFIFVFY